MNLQEFVEKNSGKVVRDGQCVALYRQYIQDVWQLPPLEGLGEDGGADGLFYRYNKDVGPRSRQYLELHQYYAAIQIPKPGDVVIFKASPTNRWGHVGIFVEMIETKMRIFEQNGIAAMSGRTDGAFLGLWDFDRVLGWLRKREAISGA